MSNLTAATANRQAASDRLDELQRHILVLKDATASLEAKYAEARADFDAAVLAEAHAIVADPDACSPVDVQVAKGRVDAAARIAAH